MARSSKTGSKKAKAKARKASPAKGRKAAKTKRGVAYKQRTGRSLEARLTLKNRELHDALAQQIATAEVLQVISDSSGDLALVFDTMLDKAMHLCGAQFGVLATYDGKTFRTAAARGLPDKYAAHRARSTGDYGPGTAPFQHLQGEPVVHIVDLMDSDAYRAGEPNRRALVDLAGARCLLCVPLLSDRRVIGCVMIFRQQARSFSDRQIALLKYFAAQAVIAIENARLFNEVQAKTHDLEGALRYQTGSANILNVIASSPTDVQPVLKAIVESACEFCEAYDAIVILKDEGELQIYAHHGPIPSNRTRWPNDRTSTSGRAMADQRPIHVHDVLSDEGVGFPMGRHLSLLDGCRTLLSAPLLREGEAIGAIALRRSEVHPFSETQIALLQTFADQAVIAIGNVRLFEELQARTRDLTESLLQQTATADVLKVISRSAFDLDSVMHTLARSATELCAAGLCGLYIREGDFLVCRGYTAISKEQEEFVRRTQIPTDDTNFYMNRALSSGEIANIGDFENDRSVGTRAFQEKLGFRSLLIVPLIREGHGIGLFVLGRDQVGEFSLRHVELVQTFADQAVIAIENARLFDEVQARTRELSESLQQQTATADVLKIISRSAFDLQAVFDTLTASAVDLLGMHSGTICVCDGEVFRFRSAAGAFWTEELWRYLQEHPAVPARETAAGRVILSRRIEQIPDIFDDPEYALPMKALAPAHAPRAMLGVPLLGKDRVEGAMVLSRQEPGPFTQREIDILQTFADQASIAIENARLFNETREALERQTATADILKVIASSPDDVQPVFDAIAERSKRLVDARSTTVFRLEDGVMYLKAFSPTSPEADATLKAGFPASLANFSWGEAISRGDIHRVLDTEQEIESMRELARLRGFRSMLFVPLLRDGTPIGVIAVTRVEPGPFVEHHVQLLQTFADQAVIAIENVRLFDEVQARTKELSQSLDDLRTAQDRLVQTEKLASLGQLTAGIAHEIKNPLNFVNNFSALSAELIDELDETLAPAPLDKRMRGDVDELTQMLKSNLEKVVQHGRRADSIVKNMLLHSREGSGEHRSVDINALVEESLNLAYHGARAEKVGFSIVFQRDLDPSVGMVDVYPQEITRVLLNLISNGFYAVTKRQEEASDGFEPMLSATTKNFGDKVEIRIRDNGTGIPDEVKEKIFHPFFTTKPTGEGTGLGLSMSHDIIVKQHGGSIHVETEPGLFTEFKIVLPRTNQR